MFLINLNIIIIYIYLLYLIIYNIIFLKYQEFLISLGVRISRFHREDRGSSPRWGKFFYYYIIIKIY